MPAVSTQVVKIFKLVAARTGLREEQATHAGYRPRTVHVTVDDHKSYYPAATELAIRLTADDDTGRLVGAQIVGPAGQVAKRIDVFAVALFHGMTVDALNGLDLSYTPPLSTDGIRYRWLHRPPNAQQQPVGSNRTVSEPCDTASPHGARDRGGSPQPIDSSEA